MNDGYNTRFEVNTPELVAIFALFVVALLLATFTCVLVRRLQLQRSKPSNRRLFDELCTAHALSWSQKRVLRRLAEARNLSNPGLIFLDMGLWPANTEAERLVGSRGRRDLCALRRNLFGHR